MTPAVSPDRATEQAPDRVRPQLLDADVPPSKQLSALPTSERDPTSAKLTRAIGPSHAHRSLYARPETLDLIREIAFKNHISAQSLYREGLLMMLQKRGFYLDKRIDDVW
ncbi:hypothetical protein [Methylobacterium oxalidis]|uniref:hypothetical protein n=1 Tax=Methylobacterium oxalidis TaxID=944322 RepID=UPI003314531F